VVRGQDQGDQTAIELGAAQYSLRKLRAGYLYVYDEKMRRLDGYRIDEYGILYRMSLDDEPLPFSTDTAPCSIPQHKGAAMCITIPNASMATRIWLAFSDVEWTREVRAAHQKSADVRKKDMTMLDVRAWLARDQHDGAQTLADVEKHVAEYQVYGGNHAQWTRVKGWEWFGSSSAAATSVDGAAGLVSAAEHLAPGKGLMFALPDPVGIAHDLSLLMQSRVKAFVSRDSVKRPLAVSTVIAQMQQAARNQAELDEIEAADAAISRAQHGYARPGGALGGVPVLPNPKCAEELRQRIKSPGYLAGVANSEWRNKYAVKFAEIDQLRWQAQYDASFRDLDREYIAPLAKAHAAWMQSDGLKSRFKGYFDPADVESGAVYSATFLLCVAGTQDKKACFDVLLKWSQESDPSDPGNFLLRAFVFNQDKLAEKVGAAINSGLDWRTLPWDALIGAYNDSVRHLAEGSASIAARLVEQVMGPLMKALDKHMESGAEKVHWLGVALGMVSRKALVRVEATGGRKAFREKVIRQMLKLSDQQMTPNQLQQAVAAELRRLEVQGVPMEGTDKKHWYVLIDAEALKTQGQNLTGTLTMVEEVEARELARWRTVITHDVRLGVVSGVVQLVCMTKLWKDAHTSMAHEQGEANWRLRAGIGALAGTTSEVFGKMLQSQKVLGLRYGQGALLALGRSLETVGRRATIVAAVGMAMLDGIRGVEEWAEGNHGISLAYFGSGALGVTILFAFLSAGPVGLMIGVICIALLFAVTIFIELFKDNKLQDWLERCFWGKLGDKRYRHLDIEMSELKLAMEG
jgi:hypothetical protein